MACGVSQPVLTPARGAHWRPFDLRGRRMAFLGTCGGFQHALLEDAEAVWGVAKAAHAELDPNAVDPVIAPLSCSLVEQSGEIQFEPGSQLAAIYGVPAAVEQ